jgi:hypothetical protein
MRFGWYAIPLLFLLADCRPSRESMSAGEIGCAPGEITVSGEESSVGFAQSAATWIAECDGRTYICTEVLTSGEKSAQSQVSCKEEGSSDSERAGASPSAAPAAAAKKTEPPAGAAGFELGATLESSQKACEGAGNTWEVAEARATCSGPATKLGFDVTVTLDMCGDRVCKITIAHTPQAKWFNALVELRTKLIDKYGTPMEIGSAVPVNCRSDEQIVGCFNQGLHLYFHWKWKTGETLRLTAGKPEKGEGIAAILLEYARPAGALGADPSAL